MVNHKSEREDPQPDPAPENPTPDGEKKPEGE